MNYKDEILRLKKEKNAVILAHYYQDSDVQDVADFLGDSYKLAVEAQNTTADIIVFCGVHFMAETAKILSPTKKVLLPVKEAGCPMANMMKKNDLLKYKSENPDTTILTYVNSTADVKALSDCCVTSSNAFQIIDHYIKAGKKILYGPDQNLAKYVMNQKGYTMDVWNGHCCIHNDLTKELAKEMKKKYPNALLLVHPEARLEVLEEADYVGSTKGILDFASASSNQEFIIGTEEGIMYPLINANPNKKFYLLTEKLRCFDMKLTTIKDVYDALNEEKYVIEVDEEIRVNAQKALDKMIELSK